MTHLHPAFEQCQRLMRTTANDYGLPPPAPRPLPPELVRQLLDQPQAQFQGSADAL